MEDQRRRTLEALERRFAQAKSEVQSQQHKSKKRPADDKKIFFVPVESLPVDSPLNKPLSVSSSIKDTEVNEPAYLKLSHSVHENLLLNGVQVSEGKITVNGVLHELFQHGDSAKKYLHGSKSIKIENTILLDKYVQRSSSSNSGYMRALQHGSKRSKKHMSLKQHKSIGTFDLLQAFQNFDIFKAMHEKWKSYIQKLLKIAGKEQLAQCFLNVDLHGAIILVVQCKTAAYVGLRGIMVRETKETFGIVTQDSKFKVVPKKISVFMLEANHWKVTLHGDKLGEGNLAGATEGQTPQSWEDCPLHNEGNDDNDDEDVVQFIYVDQSCVGNDAEIVDGCGANGFEVERTSANPSGSSIASGSNASKTRRQRKFSPLPTIGRPCSRISSSKYDEKCCSSRHMWSINMNWTISSSIFPAFRCHRLLLLRSSSPHPDWRLIRRCSPLL